MTTRITITKYDLKLGVPRTCTMCPVARAIKRKLRDGFYVSVNCRTIRILSYDYTGLEVWNTDTPGAAEGFILRYDAFTSADQRNALKTTWFNLDIPAKYLKEAA